MDYSPHPSFPPLCSPPGPLITFRSFIFAAADITLYSPPHHSYAPPAKHFLALSHYVGTRAFSYTKVNQVHTVYTTVLVLCTPPLVSYNLFTLTKFDQSVGTCVLQSTSLFAINNKTNLLCGMARCSTSDCRFRS